MICYKDMTFCEYWKECVKGKTCGRALSEDIIDDAKRTGLSISMFAEKPDCFEEKK